MQALIGHKGNFSLMVNVHTNHKAIPGEVRGGRSWQAATLRNSRANRSRSPFAVRRRRSSLSPSALPHVRHHQSMMHDFPLHVMLYLHYLLPHPHHPRSSMRTGPLLTCAVLRCRLSYLRFSFPTASFLSHTHTRSSLQDRKSTCLNSSHVD